MIVLILFLLKKNVLKAVAVAFMFNKYPHQTYSYIPQHKRLVLRLQLQILLQYALENIYRQNILHTPDDSIPSRHTLHAYV